ncbi:putative gag-pol polyprotein [Danaus plexippus plexippus]|uniref:Gag-pol polyprotein n=1 Tax=Danaus plexippus plexippus TaxID=278856 RepID=A0A212EHN9_DANPL|nr:putative gag-pol polyprotein [Danaus plexippus plexippus]
MLAIYEAIRYFRFMVEAREFQLDRSSSMGAPRHPQRMERRHRIDMEQLQNSSTFLTEAPKDFVDMSDLVDRLRAHMTKLTPEPTSWHSSSNRPFYIPKDLSTSTHVFLRVVPGRRSLQAPYTGPQRFFAHNHKTVDIEVNGKRQRVTIDRVKPAYMAREELEPSQNRPQTPHPAQPDEPVRKTRGGRTVKFPDHYRP